MPSLPTALHVQHSYKRYTETTELNQEQVDTSMVRGQQKNVFSVLQDNEASAVMIRFQCFDTANSISFTPAESPAANKPNLQLQTSGLVKTVNTGSSVFCSLAFLDPKVGHTMDVLSPFISILCHSD